MGGGRRGNARKPISTETIDVTAYATPPSENWDGASGNANAITLENYTLIKEAGFTKILALYEGRGSTAADRNADVEMALALCNQLGLQYYALNGRFYNFVRPEINASFFTEKFTVSGGVYKLNGTQVDPYDYLQPNWKELYRTTLAEILGDPAYLTNEDFAGHFASDEPSIKEMACVIEQVKAYAEFIDERSGHGECYVNLLPSYASSAQLSGTGDTTTTYEQYVKFYFENLAKLLGYVSYDHYPFTANESVRTNHLYDLAMMASYCKANDVELRAFVQAYHYQKTGENVDQSLSSSAQLSWQIYSALAFGAKEISYYTYCGSDSLFDYTTGETTTTYEWAKDINNDIASFGNAFMAYDWQGVMFYDKTTLNGYLNVNEQMKAVTNGGGTTVTAASEMAASVIVTSDEVSFVSTTDTILGVFATENGDDAYLVANYDLTSSSTVTLTFTNATSAIVYVNGAQTTVALENGVLTLNLGAGEGAFVVAQN